MDCVIIVCLDRCLWIYLCIGHCAFGLSSGARCLWLRAIAAPHFWIANDFLSATNSYVLMAVSFNAEILQNPLAHGSTKARTKRDLMHFLYKILDHELLAVNSVG